MTLGWQGLRVEWLSFMCFLGLHDPSTANGNACSRRHLVNLH